MSNCKQTFSDLVKFVMCTPVFRNCVPFSKYIKRHVYLGDQGRHDKLNQIRLCMLIVRKKTFWSVNILFPVYPCTLKTIEDLFAPTLLGYIKLEKRKLAFCQNIRPYITSIFFFCPRESLFYIVLYGK